MITRNLILSFLIVLPMLAFGGEKKDKYTIVEVGQPAPEFTYIKDDTLSLKSSDLKGKVILVNFFAFWCPPCKKELPRLESDIWSKHKDDENFEMLVVGRGQTSKEIKIFFKERGYSLPYSPDTDKKIFEVFAKDIIPRSYVIDKNGIVVHQALGFNEEDFKKMVMVVDSLLMK